MDYSQDEKTKRWTIFWIGFSVVMVVAIGVIGIAYGNTLAREEQIQRYAIIQQRGGEPFCITPDGSVLVKYPKLQQTPGETG